ncbi:hypothetical protein ES703_29479 [subsurface metagenome]
MRQVKWQKTNQTSVGIMVIFPDGLQNGVLASCSYHGEF